MAKYISLWWTFYICCLLFVEFGQIFGPLLRDVSCLQDQNSLAPTNKPTLTLRSCAQHVFVHPPKNTQTLTLRVAPIYPPNKKYQYLTLRIAHPVTFLAFITMRLPSTCSFVSNKGMGYSKNNVYIWEKPKGKRGKSILKKL